MVEAMAQGGLALAPVVWLEERGLRAQVSRKEGLEGL